MMINKTLKGGENKPNGHKCSVRNNKSSVNELEANTWMK
jgi:hypothetical protein